MIFWVKKSAWILSFILLSLCLADFCQKQTKGFRAHKITPSEKAMEVKSSSEEEISHILETPFYYLKKGKSSYVFSSKDEKYVIKFFQSPQIIPPYWSTWKPVQFFFSSICNKTIEEKNSKKNLQFTSYQMAFNLLKSQTGTIYLHLNTTSHLNKTITLYDNIGVKHSFLADKTAFVLQKKALPFCPYFKKLLKDQKKEEAKLLVTQFAEFLKERSIKRISDHDISPQYNLGILEGSLLTFDLDSLRPSDPSFTSIEHMRHDAKKMKSWLRHRSPELATFLEEELIRLQ